MMTRMGIIQQCNFWDNIPKSADMSNSDVIVLIQFVSAIVSYALV